MTRTIQQTIRVVILILLSACNTANTVTPPTPAINFNALPLCSSGVPLPSSTVAVNKNEEVRAFWVDGFHAGIKSPQEVEQLIRDVQAARMNTIVVQVRRQGDALYNLGIEPRIDDLKKLPDYDPLAYLIEKAHAATPPIEVHAWVNALAIGGTTTAITPDHVLAKHGAEAVGDERWLSETSTGSVLGDNLYFLDPGHPQAAQYTVDVYRNIVRQYAVDGIHLDFIRYAGKEWGYNLTSVARFNLHYGLSGKPDPKDERWLQWRRDQVTNLMRQIYLEAIAIKPLVKVSAAVIAWGDGPASIEDWQRTSAYTDVFQDWNGWLRDGLLDIAFPMNYDRETNTQQKQWFDRWLKWEKENRYGRYVVVGVGAFINDLDGTLAQTVRARTPSAKGEAVQGVAFYSYADSNVRGLSLSKLINALTQPDDGTKPIFAENVSTPVMPWKSDLSAGHLYGTFATPQDKTVVTLNGKCQLNVSATNFFGAVYLPVGSYTVEAWRDGKVFAKSVVQVEGGKAVRVGLR